MEGIERAFVLDLKYLQQQPLPAIADDINKNGRGHALIIAGSREVPGAALLAATAAFRAGAGKVTVATSEAVALALSIALPEVRVIALQDLPDGGLKIDDAQLRKISALKIDAVLIGPGMQDEDAARVLIHRLNAVISMVPLILDACAISCVRDIEDSAQPRLITPHSGEMAHFSHADLNTVETQAPLFARRVAQQWRCITALKGATTHVATPDGRLFIYNGGHCGLAMSGSGDCLSGLIVGLAARGALLEQACLWGVFIHGSIGERLATRYGGIGYLAREIPCEIPALLNGVDSDERLRLSCGSPAEIINQ